MTRAEYLTGKQLLTLLCTTSYFSLIFWAEMFCYLIYTYLYMYTSIRKNVDYLGPL